jgi:3,4-dihydroxyphenylacetate 2,3-dioxygenase
MGEVVGAGLLAHVPTMVLPESTRRELNEGNDTTLDAGLRQLREVEFVITGHERRSGLFTSEEHLEPLTAEQASIQNA